MSQDSLTAGLE